MLSGGYGLWRCDTMVAIPLRGVCAWVYERHVYGSDGGTN